MFYRGIVLCYTIFSVSQRSPPFDDGNNVCRTNFCTFAAADAFIFIQPGGHAGSDIQCVPWAHRGTAAAGHTFLADAGNLGRSFHTGSPSQIY